MEENHKYSLRPKILVGGMDVSRHNLVLDTPIFIRFFDKYFRTEGVRNNDSLNAIKWNDYFAQLPSASN